MTRYTFAVYITAPAPVDAEDVDGYTKADVEARLKEALTHPTSPIRRDGSFIDADWELMDQQTETP